MLTAEGIISKLVSFIVNKSIGKIVDLPFDKRKKACRSLTKLYYCIQALDEVTDYFEISLKSLEDSGDSTPLIHALSNNSYHIELATNMFIDLGCELHDGLEIIDPTLAKCCHLLYISKFDFLSYLSNYVKIENGNGKISVIVKQPKGIIESVDLESLYAETKKAMKGNNEKFYWPSSALDDFRNDFEDISISFENDETTKQLHSMIREQNKKLKEAKEKLRVLLKDSFSIEEILFQSDSKPEYRL